MRATLNTVLIPDTSIVADGAIPFATNNVATGCGIIHTAGSTTVVIKKPGIYLVEFGCDCLPGSQVLTTFQLTNNGNNVQGASASFTGVASTTNTAAFSTLVKVLPSCAVIDNSANLQVTVDVASTVGNCGLTVVQL